MDLELPAKVTLVALLLLEAVAALVGLVLVDLLLTTIKPLQMVVQLLQALLLAQPYIMQVVVVRVQIIKHQEQLMVAWVVVRLPLRTKAAQVMVGRTLLGLMVLQVHLEQQIRAAVVAVQLMPPHIIRHQLLPVQTAVLVSLLLVRQLPQRL